MKYSVEIKESALKALEKIDGAFRKKIRDQIRTLADEPRPYGSLKLSGKEIVYRIRVGQYRVIYEIHDSKVLVYVVNIDHRKDVYK
jgi:mRNA interferase RelE/StbE